MRASPRSPRGAAARRGPQRPEPAGRRPPGPAPPNLAAAAAPRAVRPALARPSGRRRPAHPGAERRRGGGGGGPSSMPRRKQQAPRRSAAYVPKEELKAAETDEETVEEGELSLGLQEGEFLCNEEAETKEAQSFQNSPVSTATNQDAGYASPFSESSDQPARFKTPASREEKEDPPGAESVSYPQDSLAQIKAVYANLFSESCWSSLALDLKKPGSTTSHSDAGPKESTPPTPPAAATPAAAPASTPSTSSSTGHSASTSSSGSGSGYDWHQAALAKTLQQTTSYGLLPEPSLFSTVQLYRQNNKLYGSVFTGASKFRCKDCSAAYETLVELTVHMNETGHYRDDNRDKDSEKTKRWSKPRKRSLMEMEGKEDAQKVLKCMYCGHSFESLQDLSVHMIKTKHYQKVPLKEPVPAIAKLVPSTKKRALQDLASPCSPEPAGLAAAEVVLGESAKDQKAANPYVTPNNRYGYQNGASYTWQFEARKAQILKCMECGSSHDTLQQLTAHMMVTGHFLKVTTSASKKGKQLALDPVVEEKIQSIPLPPTTHTRLPAASIKKPPDSPAGPPACEEKKEPDKEKAPAGGEPDRKIKEESEDSAEKFEPTALYQYLREEDLDDSPRGGMDILKSLENTVSTAISKAQNGAPSWGGYPSIHAAYQLPGTVKPLPPAGQSLQGQPSYAGGAKPLTSEHGTLLHSPGSLTPPPHKSNVSAMEELVEKVTGKGSGKKEEKAAEKERGGPAKSTSPVAKENKDCPRAEEVGSKQPSRKSPEAEVGKAKREGPGEGHTPNGTEPLKVKVTNGCSNLGIITDHSPETPFINPLSALQSIMNTHLGKVSKPASPSLDPLAMLYKISNSMLDKPVYPSLPGKPADAIDRYYYENSDQPIDLTKSKSRPLAPGAADPMASPLRESALMDISDMVKNLTGRLTPKSSTPSTVSEKSDADGSSFEEALDELSPVHKRKGRQSNWNPQHLLILQAQFASSLRETPEGKYIMSDLGPQERVHVSKFTGLSMTTISHWLANVKYQLRRTGGTKFLKNLDTGHPVFFCNDCASQFRTASTYVSHLETHLGFSLKDLSKLPLGQIQDQQNVSRGLASKALAPPGLAEEDTGSTFQCKLCNRTFASKHAVKLHLSKTHGKSPEDHLIYVTELDRQ
ncbi:teashirt homolog 1 [Choloepus didactylus]|uniref:teashirt homolog 1 n=1 Tax=Choloepus didactylus TaxID=27675 RepID=UPI00189C5DA0|nr:teashirt homolog 1 [Choloepus didactylus]